MENMSIIEIHIKIRNLAKDNEDGRNDGEINDLLLEIEEQLRAEKNSLKSL